MFVTLSFGPAFNSLPLRLAVPTLGGKRYHTKERGDNPDGYRRWLASAIVNQPAIRRQLQAARQASQAGQQVGMGCYCAAGERCNRDVLAEALGQTGSLESWAKAVLRPQQREEGAAASPLADPGSAPSGPVAGRRARVRRSRATKATKALAA